MKPWVLAAVAVILPGGWLVALAVWLRRRWLARDARAVDALIKPPRPVFEGSDEGLRQRTEKRRQAANGIRGRAARVESGSPVSDVLRLVKREKGA